MYLPDRHFAGVSFSDLGWIGRGVVGSVVCYAVRLRSGTRHEKHLMVHAWPMQQGGPCTLMEGH
jgi:hypothetical protein